MKAEKEKDAVPWDWCCWCPVAVLWDWCCWCPVAVLWDWCCWCPVAVLWDWCCWCPVAVLWDWCCWCPVTVLWDWRAWWLVVKEQLCYGTWVTNAQQLMGCIWRPVLLMPSNDWSAVLQYWCYRCAVTNQLCYKTGVTDVQWLISCVTRLVLPMCSDWSAVLQDWCYRCAVTNQLCYKTGVTNVQWLISCVTRLVLLMCSNWSAVSISCVMRLVLSMHSDCLAVFGDQCCWCPATDQLCYGISVVDVRQLTSCIMGQVMVTSSSWPGALWDWWYWHTAGCGLRDAALYFMLGWTYLLQKHTRRFLAQRLLQRLQLEQDAAITLQRLYRGWRVRRAYLAYRDAIIFLQCHLRAFITRRRYSSLPAFMLCFAGGQFWNCSKPDSWLMIHVKVRLTCP